MNKRIIDSMSADVQLRDVTSSIEFYKNSSTEKLRLNEKGFYYNDQFIEDAGTAYIRFMKWLDSAEAERVDTL